MTLANYPEGLHQFTILDLIQNRPGKNLPASDLHEFNLLIQQGSNISQTLSKMDQSKIKQTQIWREHWHRQQYGELTSVGKICDDTYPYSWLLELGMFHDDSVLST